MSAKENPLNSVKPINNSNTSVKVNSVNNISGSKPATSSINSLSSSSKPATSSVSNSVDNIEKKKKNNLSRQEQNILNRLNNIIISPAKNLKAKINNNSLDNQKEELNLRNNDEVIRDDNYMVILGLFVSFIIVLVMYFLSKTFNVGRTLKRMRQYEYDNKITNYSQGSSNIRNTKLQNSLVMSSYNSCHSGEQMYSYSSEHVLVKVIKSGCRYIEFNVFSSKFGEGAIPVINNGYRKGQYRTMLNNTSFEEAIRVIILNAFSISTKDGGCPNPNDPLFISLNLNTGYNIFVLDKIADILLDYLNNKLLSPEYSYQFKNDINNLKLKELEGKVIIFASKGFEGSKLEELVNSSWVDYTNTDTNPNIRLGLESFVNFSSKSKYKKHKKSKIMNKTNKSFESQSSDSQSSDSLKSSKLSKQSLKSKNAEFYKKFYNEKNEKNEKNQKNGKNGKNGKNKGEEFTDKMESNNFGDSFTVGKNLSADYFKQTLNNDIEKSKDNFKYLQNKGNPSDKRFQEIENKTIEESITELLPPDNSESMINIDSVNYNPEKKYDFDYLNYKNILNGNQNNGNNEEDNNETNNETNNYDDNYEDNDDNDNNNNDYVDNNNYNNYNNDNNNNNNGNKRKEKFENNTFNQVSKTIMEKMEDTAPFSVFSENSNIDEIPKIIRISSKLFNHPGFDGSKIKSHNKNGLTIVVPHTEGDYYTRNYDAQIARDLGCQFICMNFQKIDSHIGEYINMFTKNAIITN